MSHKRLENLALSESGFIFDPLNGSTFSTNAAGLVVLKALRRTTTRKEIIAALTQEFQVLPGDDLERDLDEFIQALRREALVDAAFRIQKTPKQGRA